MAVVFLGLGSNLGNRKENIDTAVGQLQEIGMVIEKQSSLIETDPVGGPPQSKFLNGVIKTTTSLTPQELLKTIKQIEERMGRTKTVINGPRVIDIDILTYDSVSLKSDTLTIPHPRMFERSFVMQPLLEIEPNIAKDHLNENHYQ